MKIISIQVGMPKEINYQDKKIVTGFFKEPVTSPVRVRYLGLEGDGQADLRVHGGADKAVYAFSLDAYEEWRKKRPHDELSHGAFGENLTIDEFHEDEIFVGDQFRIGSAILEAAQPRQPCFKLGIKFKDASSIGTFTQMSRPGIYFRVIEEGVIAPGEKFEKISEEKERISILEFLEIINNKSFDEATHQKLLRISSLPENFKSKL